MRTLSALCLVSALALPAAAQQPENKPAPAAKPAAKPAAQPTPAAAASSPADDEKALYAVGLSIWQSLGVFDLTPAEFEIVKRGLTDAAAGKPTFPALHGIDASRRLAAECVTRAQAAVTSAGLGGRLSDIAAWSLQRKS